MPHDRFYVNTPFHESTQVDLQEEARHLKVMRIRAGETIELVNGENRLALAKVEDAHTATIFSIEERPPPLPIILCQALPRLNRLDTIVEKGTELGMTELWLFPGTLSEKKDLSLTQLNRLKQIAIAALKQCGRLDLPKITVIPKISKWEGLPYPAFYGDTSKEAPPLFTLLKEESGICFVVGPEAGFAPAELELLNKLKVQGVNLHPWTLRTDTASLVALSQITQKRICPLT